MAKERNPSYPSYPRWTNAGDDGTIRISDTAFPRGSDYASRTSGGTGTARTCPYTNRACERPKRAYKRFGCGGCFYTAAALIADLRNNNRQGDRAECNAAERGLAGAGAGSVEHAERGTCTYPRADFCGELLDCTDTCIDCPYWRAE